MEVALEATSLLDLPPELLLQHIPLALLESTSDDLDAVLAVAVSLERLSACCRALRPLHSCESALPKLGCQQPADLECFAVLRALQGRSSLVTFSRPNFRPNGDSLESSNADLDAYAAVLHRHPQLKIFLEGHSAATADGVADNISRAIALRAGRALVCRGISASRLTMRCWGEQVAAGASEWVDPMRRVEVFIELDDRLRWPLRPHYYAAICAPLALVPGKPCSAAYSVWHDGGE